MKTQFVYMGRKPSLASRRELLELMPVLDIEYIPYDGGDIETENRFGYLTIKWDWLRSFFDAPDIACLSLQKADIKEAGITKHWGFYSLDSDLDHQFYITDLGDKLDARAKANGFKTNMAWMFCHEFLHGHVWGRTRNVLASAQSVHAWEEQGKLKEHLAEAMEDYQTQATLIEKLLALVGLLKKKPTLTLHKRLPSPYNRYISQGYGVENPIYKITGRHIGIDYSCPVGTPIYAPADGEVIVSGNSGELGNFCYFRYIWEGKTRVERNLHLKAVPNLGKRKRGWIIGFSGNTGMSTGPHYHVDGFWNEVNTGNLNKTNWDKLTYNPEI